MIWLRVLLMVSMEDSRSVSVHRMDLLNDGRTTAVASPVLAHHSVNTVLRTSLAHLQSYTMCLMVSVDCSQHLHMLLVFFPLILLATRRAWLARSQLNPLILECAHDFLVRFLSLRWSVP